MNRKLWLYGEPAIDEMLLDPVIRLMMRCDDVSEADIRRTIRPARDRLRCATPELRVVA